MTQLAANVDADDELWTLDNLPTPAAPYIEVGSELVEVRARFPSQTYSLTGQVLPPKIRVRRGAGGTTAASHLQNATLTPTYGLGGGAGGGSLTLDNTVDAPAEVTTIIAAGAEIDGEEATLPYVTTDELAVKPDIVSTNARGHTDGVTVDSDATFTSATANFAAGDVGSFVNALGVPALTTIVSVTDPGSVELSAVATANGTGIPFTVIEPAPIETSPGMLWVRTLHTGGDFGTLVYQLRVRNLADSNWEDPTLAGADEGGAVGAYVAFDAGGPGVGQVSVHAIGVDGTTRVVLSVNTLNVFVDSWYDYDASLISDELILGAGGTILRHTNLAGDETQIIQTGDTGIAVTTVGAATFTYNGSEVAVVP